jgi:transcriptional regulator with XRE-family HTH domain
MLEFDGSKLKQLRKDRKMTQGALGLEVNRGYSHIANYENGTARPPADVLLTLMKYFGVTPEVLGRPKQIANN